MIDPKLNEIPVDETLNEEVDETTLTAEQRAARARKRQGLSINDTVAANANLSVGGRGVDTSGAEAGSGSGAGMTTASPGKPGDSPAPEVATGARGSGVTPRSSTDKR